jgi:alanyl aminopeptidase
MMVHAHELAHQWFGNLVTPYWWNDIWLNEAFATWMSYTALNPVFPEQNFNQSILLGSLGAMSSDSLVNARQIRQPIHSNHDISSAFDSITYRKGGGVLEMMNAFLTPEQFRMGIQNYMNKYTFKNANADEFIAAISEASQNIPPEVIKTAFNSFLEQPGIPYLTISASCEDGINKLAINQTRYLPLGSKGASDNQTWKIPACMNYEIEGKEHRDCHMIDAKEQNISLAGTGCAAFIMPNTNGSGYYRYSLNTEDWSKLYDNLDNLTTNEIISLNDSFSASVANGKIDLVTLMKFAPIIARSELSSIASSPMATLTNMKEKIAESKEQEMIIAQVANELYQPHYQRLGINAKDNDTVEDTKLRNAVVRFIADTGNNKAVREKLIDMAKTYTGYKTDGELHEDLVNTNLLTTALSIAVEDLDQDFTNHLVALLDKAKDGTIRGRLLSAISSTNNPKFVEELRGWILSDRLRSNEIFTILFSQVGDKDKQEGMWTWVKDNFEAFKLRIPTWIQGRLPFVGSGFCSEEKKNELKNFFDPIVEDLSGGPRTLAQVTESIDLCIVKRAHDKVMLKEYLTTLK